MFDMTSIQRQMLALCSLISAGDRCDWGVLAQQAHRERSLEGLTAAAFSRPAREPTPPGG